MKRKTRIRITAFVLVILIISMMTMSVFAESKSVKPKSGTTQSTFVVKTPYQWKWWWQSLKTMTVTVKNTGNCGVNVNLFAPKGYPEAYKTLSLSPGQSGTYTLQHNDREYRLVVGYYNNYSYSRGVTVTTSAGSVRVA